MTLTEILTVVVAGLIVLSLVWYFVRGRSATSAASGVAHGDDLDQAQERQRAVAAAEEERTEAMVRRYCPHCAEEVEVRLGSCVQCGYRFG